MMLATDIQYAENSAVAAAILFRKWEKNEIELAITKPIGSIEQYETGSFYTRELPCIVALLEEILRHRKLVRDSEKKAKNLYFFYSCWPPFRNS